MPAWRILWIKNTRPKISRSKKRTEGGWNELWACPQNWNNKTNKQIVGHDGRTRYLFNPIAGRGGKTKKTHKQKRNTWDIFHSTRCRTNWRNKGVSQRRTPPPKLFSTNQMHQTGNVIEAPSGKKNTRRHSPWIRHFFFRDLDKRKEPKVSITGMKSSF